MIALLGAREGWSWTLPFTKTHPLRTSHLPSTPCFQPSKELGVGGELLNKAHELNSEACPSLGSQHCQGCLAEGLCRAFLE